MVKTIINRRDWQTKLLPVKHAVIPLDRHFTHEDMKKIRAGVRPEQMEDRWFIYWENNQLFFHRSWTGYCIYVANFNEDDEGARMMSALVNRDPEQYTQINDEADKYQISLLIDLVVLRLSS